jgi:hypothetical protein
VENLLKALIGGHDERFAFTHNIASLTDQLAGLGEQLPVDLALVQSLTSYAGVWRYQEPDPISVTQKEELLLTVATPGRFTLNRLTVLRPGVDWASI